MTPPTQPPGDYRVHYQLSDAHREQLFEFYFDQWWCRQRTREQVERALAASYVAVVCDREDRLVGFARMLSDGAVFAWLGDVMVRPELRGTGLGDAVMEAALAHPELSEVAKWDLSCLPEMDPFYARWDFADPAPSHNLRLTRPASAPTG